MKLFQYAVIWEPTEKQEEDEGQKPKVIVGITDCLARDERAATMMASRAIPEEYAAGLDQVVIAVRPF